MIKSQGCPLFLLLSLLSGSYSVYGNVSKRGCLGDSIKIIENISYNSNDIVVSIYKNGDNKFILGMWHIQDGIPAIRNGQSDRLVLDKKGNIWILNLIISDEAKYTIKIDIGNSSIIYDVALVVMAPPTRNCKPNIIPAGNNLFAELKNDECGRPAASAYWLEHPGISISRQVIQLSDGNDKGIYHACIEGDSLICAKISNFSEHCSFYNKSKPKSLTNQSVVDGSTPRIFSGSDNIPCASSETSITTIIICVMLALLLILPIVKTFYQRCKRVPEHKIRRSLPGNSDPNNPPGASEPQNGQSLSGNSSPSNPPAGGGIGTHGNNEETGLNTGTVQGEEQPLLDHINDGRPKQRMYFDTSTSEAERNDTVCKGLVEGDSDHSIPKGMPESQDQKMSNDIPHPSLLEVSGETEVIYSVQATKPTGTRQKNITPLPPEKP